MLQNNERGRLVCYYAHPMPTYNTQQEIDDIMLLDEMGFKVISPNSPEIEENYKKDTHIDRMAFFKQFIDKCDVVVFRSFINGLITSGVVYELEYATKIGKPILEISNFNNLKPRILDYVQTKELFAKL